MPYVPSGKEWWKFGLGFTVGWFALMSIWPLTEWWLRFLDKALRVHP